MKSPATMASGYDPDRVGDLGLEGAVAVAQQHRHRARSVWFALATARSRWPSPVKSPATIASGPIPDRVGDLGLEGAVAVAQQHRHGADPRSPVGDGQVEDPVAGEVTRHDARPDRFPTA